MPLCGGQCWTDGDFGIGDEAAPIEAIRKDKPITRSNDEIIDFMADALMEEASDAQQCLDRLAVRD
jgi:hypothetical protein